MAQKRFVGLFIQGPYLGDQVVFLNRRSTINPHEHRKQNHSGICQASVFGGVLDDESFDAGLLREAEQELGPWFGGYLTASYLIDSSYKCSLVDTIEDERCISQFFTLRMPDEKWLQKVMRPLESAEFVPVTPEVHIDLVQPEMKLNGVRSLDQLVMFPDAREALRQVLDAF